MGRAPCCSKVGMRKGAWTKDEDMLLTNYIDLNGEGNWRSLPMKAGLRRCGKSCRLRWVNYLRPDIKRGRFSPEEDNLIVRLHSLLGARWSLISGRLPGRTDNDVKNHWNTYLLKKLKAAGIKPRARPYPPKAVKKNHHEGTSCEKTTVVKKRRRVNLLQQKKPEIAIMENTEVLVEKIQVHRPKAIRLSTSGYNCDDSSIESSFQENEEKITPLRSCEEVVDYKKEEKLEEGFVPIISSSSSSLVIEEDNAKIKLFDELLNGSSECSRQISSSCYMLNEVYKEYLQLLSEIGDIP